MRGEKAYEFTNHLGNVLSEHKLAVNTTPDNHSPQSGRTFFFLLEQKETKIQGCE